MFTFIKRIFHWVEDSFRTLSKHKRMSPSFLIIGAQKAGTSALFHYLLQHPAVGSPKTKEVHFFDKNMKKGLGWYLGQFPLRRKGLSLTGEASPFYLFHSAVPERVHQIFPKMKLIAVLREPVSRAFSHYQMELRRKRETGSFEDAIERELEKLPNVETDSEFYQHKSYLARGLYAEQLNNWYKHFGKDQILVIRSSALQSNTMEVLAQVYEFLGLEHFEPSDLNAQHVGKYPTLSNEINEKLSRYFEQSNVELVEMLGSEFEKL